MSSASASDDDGTVVVTTDGEASTIAPGHSVTIHRHDGMEPGAAFFMGMFMGAFILWLLQREGRRRSRRPDAAVVASVHDVSRDEVAALARRTATLEQIVTDPAARTAREIDALR